MIRISLTPIIDVVFILLIFFMLATNFQKFNQMNINIATETAAPSVLDKELFIIEFNDNRFIELKQTDKGDDEGQWQPADAAQELSSSPPSSCMKCTDCPDNLDLSLTES